jgi:magnesium-transporting ATPase (P-type)
MKIKSSLATTTAFKTHALISKLTGTIDYEGPNKRLYTFVGKGVIDNQVTPVDNDSIILRGSVLRNTKWIYAVIVYAGRQSKIQMNSKRARQKMSNVERVANKVLAAVLAFQMCLIAVAIVGNVLVWGGADENKAMWQMPYLAESGKSPHELRASRGK